MSRFSQDRSSFRTLSRCPGQSSKNSRLGNQSAIMNTMWSDNRNRMLEQNVKDVITCKINNDFFLV